MGSVFSEYKIRGTEAARIPPGWSTAKVGDICQCRGGHAFPHRFQGKSEGELPFYKVSDMNLKGNENEMYKANNYIDKRELAILKAKTVRSGATIFPKVGAAIQTNKKRFLKVEAVVDNNVMAVWVSDETACTDEYLYSHFRTTLLSDLSNVGPLPSITNARVKESGILLPPLSEQRRITAVLNTIQDEIAAQDDLIKALREFKRSVMARLFTYGACEGPEETKMTETGEIPVGWDTIGFQQAIAKKQFKVGKVKARDYLKYGEFPIIDQSKDAVAGYWDDPDALFDGQLPVIVFGDHTRVFKYVDFRFVCGADGTKIIQPNTDIFLPSFLYFALQHLSLPNKGYNRHFGLLKEQVLKCPPLSEQRCIADFLNTIQDNVAAEEDRKSALQELFRSVLQELMTGQIRLLSDEGLPL